MIPAVPHRRFQPDHHTPSGLNPTARSGEEYRVSGVMAPMVMAPMVMAPIVMAPIILRPRHRHSVALPDAVAVKSLLPHT